MTNENKQARPGPAGAAMSERATDDELREIAASIGSVAERYLRAAHAAGVREGREAMREEAAVDCLTMLHDDAIDALSVDDVVRTIADRIRSLLPLTTGGDDV